MRGHQPLAVWIGAATYEMTFNEWNNRNNWDGLNAGGAWDAALDEAIAVCTEVNDQSEVGDAIDMILGSLRAMKRSPGDSQR